MALFNSGKKKEEAKKSCCCGSEAKAEQAAGCCCGSEAREESACCGAPVEGICCLKVLSAGCKSCHEQYENAKAAVSHLGLHVDGVHHRHGENHGIRRHVHVPTIV